MKSGHSIFCVVISTIAVSAAAESCNDAIFAPVILHAGGQFWVTRGTDIAGWGEMIWGDPICEYMCTRGDDPKERQVTENLTTRIIFPNKSLYVGPSKKNLQPPYQMSAVFTMTQSSSFTPSDKNEIRTVYLQGFNNTQPVYQSTNYALTGKACVFVVQLQQEQYPDWSATGLGGAACKGHYDQVRNEMHFYAE